jgi:all-trans-retinol dehydrogenase (NAD+)
MPLIMGFSVDTIVNLLTHTILHPLALISFLAYEAKKVQGWPVCTGYTTTAYYILALYAGIRLSNRWRNGLILRPRLNVHTWPEEIVLVTGGAQGIAKSVCEKLAKKGAKVAAVDIVQFKPSHPNIKAYKCDISKYAELEKVKTKIAKDLDGQVTMVANIAGLNNKSLILDLDEDRVSKMIDVNLKSREYHH